MTCAGGQHKASKGWGLSARASVGALVAVVAEVSSSCDARALLSRRLRRLLQLLGEPRERHALHASLIGDAPSIPLLLGHAQNIKQRSQPLGFPFDLDPFASQPKVAKSIAPVVAGGELVVEDCKSKLLHQDAVAVPAVEMRPQRVQDARVDIWCLCSSPSAARPAAPLMQPLQLRRHGLPARPKVRDAVTEWNTQPPSFFGK